MTNVLSRPVNHGPCTTDFLKVTKRSSRPDMWNFPIPSWVEGLLHAILKNRTMKDGEYTIHNWVVYKLITRHIVDVPFYLRGWLTPHRLMVLIRFVPVGNGLWKEPCLTKGCKGWRKDGTKCTYGHPVSKADGADNWRDPVAEALIPQGLFDKATEDKVENWREPERTKRTTAVSPFPPCTIEKQWRRLALLVSLLNQ